MTIRIVTDSTCDLPSDTVTRFGIRIVPMYINVGSQSYLDGIDMQREEFYTKLPNFPHHPTTAVPSMEKFRNAYASLEQEGASEILSIHIATALSGVVGVAQSAAREYKGPPVTVLDSRQLSLGTGFLVETAAKMAATGSKMTEIRAALESQIKRSHVFAGLNTLEFLRRSGRMNTFMASLGALLKLKPILKMYDGKPATERVRTSDGALKRLVELLDQIGPLERVAIVHTHAEGRVAELQTAAASLLPEGDILIANITPVIGAHIGPGAVGFAAISK